MNVERTALQERAVVEESTEGTKRAVKVERTATKERAAEHESTEP